jgi:hypothetical protein
MELPVHEIKLDPERFQSRDPDSRSDYRVDLSDVSRFCKDSAGFVSVWRDCKGGLIWMVDGHQRLDLAKRTGTAFVTVQFLNYETAEEALVAGALLNVAQWVNYPTRRLWAICNRLSRIDDALQCGCIPSDSPIWERVLNHIPELSETVYAHSRLKRQRCQ